MSAAASTDEPETPPFPIRLRLYLAGSAPNSALALTNLRAALASLPEASVELETIDVLQDPDRALQDGILVTPMLVKLAPLPERRVLGNLRDRAVLFHALGVERASDE